MQVLLNIGLDNVPVVGQSYTHGVRNPPDVERLFTAGRTLREEGFKIHSAKMIQSDSEPTFVGWVTFCGMMVDFKPALDRVARRLNQDCVAVYNSALCWGLLVGPRADDWGPFNPEFFFLPDGNRLQAPAAKAA